jgi:hypothetical protein
MRRAEVIAAGGAALLGAALFLLPCFAQPARGPTLDGWRALTTTRWLLLVTIAVTAALVLLTLGRRAPALLVATRMLTCVLGGLSSLVLLFRVIDHPGLSARAGVYVAFVAALAVAYGGYLALRTEGGSSASSIEMVRPGDEGQPSSARSEPTSAAPHGP